MMKERYVRISLLFFYIYIYHERDDIEDEIIPNLEVSTHPFPWHS